MLFQRLPFNEDKFTFECSCWHINILCILIDIILHLFGFFMGSICLQLFHNMFEFQNRNYISIGWILQREILCVQIQHPSATFLIWCAPASPCLTLYYEDLAGLPVGRDSASIFSIFTSSILTYFFGYTLRTSRHWSLETSRLCHLERQFLHSPSIRSHLTLKYAISAIEKKTNSMGWYISPMKSDSRGQKVCLP